MGFIGFCMLAFSGYVMISYFEITYYIFKLIRESFIMLMDCLSIKHRKTIIKNRDKINAEQPINYQQQLDHKVNVKIANMKMNYPFADKELLDKYITRYNSLPLYEIERLENAIMYSHYTNANKPENKPTKLHIAGVRSLNHFDQVYAYPITMKFYHIGIDYALLLENHINNEFVMYQSRSHNELLNIAYQVHDNALVKKNNNEEIITSELFNKELFPNVIEIH